MAASVRIKDLGFEAIKKRLLALNKSFVTVGVHQEQNIRQGADGATGANMSLIAWVQEFGTSDGRIPERSYMRSTIDEEQERIASLIKKGVVSITVDRMSQRQALSIVGQFVQTAIQKKITSLRDPPNTPSTIAQKGSSNPLIDTGQLRASIQYDVRIGENRTEVNS